MALCVVGLSGHRSAQWLPYGTVLIALYSTVLHFASISAVLPQVIVHLVLVAVTCNRCSSHLYRCCPNMIQRSNILEQRRINIRHEKVYTRELGIHRDAGVAHTRRSM